MELRALAERLAESLLQRRRTLVSAESCTGGWIAKVLTDVPGSSRWYLGGVVAYSNGLKQSLLDVGTATLAAYGAVSEATACAMARGALTRLGGDLAVAVTGIAGPDGGQPDKPVGTVWLACAWSEAQRMDTQTRLLRLDGDRETIRRNTVAAALEQAFAIIAARPW